MSRSNSLKITTRNESSCPSASCKFPRVLAVEERRFFNELLRWSPLLITCHQTTPEKVYGQDTGTEMEACISRAASNRAPKEMHRASSHRMLPNWMIPQFASDIIIFKIHDDKVLDIIACGVVSPTTIHSRTFTFLDHIACLVRRSYSA